jgi:hypothetical protein
MNDKFNMHNIYRPSGKHCVLYIKNKRDVKKARALAEEAMTTLRDSKVIAEYIEETSRKNSKPELVKAVDKTNQKANRLLLIPFPDYLSRNITAITEFMRIENRPYIAVLGRWNHKTEFRQMYISTMLTTAEDILKRSAQNKRDGIARKKATGWKAGNPQLDRATINASKAREELADEYTKNIIKTIREIQSYDQTTLQQIANALMQRGLKTRRGKDTWTPAGVSNILKRATKLRI